MPKIQKTQKVQKNIENLTTQVNRLRLFISNSDLGVNKECNRLMCKFLDVILRYTEFDIESDSENQPKPKLSLIKTSR